MQPLDARYHQVMVQRAIGRKSLRAVVRAARAAGIEPRRVLWFPQDITRYVANYRAFSRAVKTAPQERWPIELYPILHDWHENAGVASGHYFHQDIWAARKIIDHRPISHFDIGSRIDGFVAHLLANSIEVTVVDVRPMGSSIAGLTFVEQDATTLSTVGDSTLTSISCLHAVEHFGLGRYGDPIDPIAHQRALLTFARKLAPGGNLYVSAPIGRQRIEFNAHRVFAPSLIPEVLAGLELVEFSAVGDSGQTDLNATPSDFCGSDFALGLYHMRKPS